MRREKMSKFKIVGKPLSGRVVILVVALLFLLTACNSKEELAVCQHDLTTYQASSAQCTQELGVCKDERIGLKTQNAELNRTVGRLEQQVNDTREDLNHWRNDAETCQSTVSVLTKTAAIAGWAGLILELLFGFGFYFFGKGVDSSKRLKQVSGVFWIFLFFMVLVTIIILWAAGYRI